MKISIVTPTLNQDRFIERTIRSVVFQAGDFDMEYIIVDGGSTDQTLEILKKYSDLHKQNRIGNRVNSFAFEWTSGKDAGQTEAINKGLKRAGGDIVAYLNSDDLYEDQALQKVADFFDKNPQEKIVTGYCRIIDERDREIRKWITAYKNRSLRSLTFEKLLLENPVSQPATFWRRELHGEIGYFDVNQHLVMDYEMWLRIAARYRIHVLPTWLAFFRWYQESKSGDRFRQQFAEQYAAAARFIGNRPALKRRHRFHVRKTILAYSAIKIVRKWLRN